LRRQKQALSYVIGSDDGAQDMGTPFDELTTIGVVEFVNRLRHCLTEHKQRVTWFLGAGCSVSSGIPTAGGLVDRWLRQLYDLQGKHSRTYESWVLEAFPQFDRGRPGEYYAKVFARRHPSPLERQREIELVCSGGQPGYGYATFAQLLSRLDVGHLCNTILTTNFDDLVADALYLYGERHARPQIIAHEALTHFARMTSPRPTVVKLHGDAHLEPRNLEPETARIKRDVCQHLYPFLSDSALIFVGYGGNDQSIATFLDEHPDPALTPQIYWVGKDAPSSDLLSRWLKKRQAVRVDHHDFDQLMHLVRGTWKIDHPDTKKRMGVIDENYYRRHAELEKEIEDVTDPIEKEALEKASEETSASLPDVWELLSRARRLKTIAPNEAERLYQSALKSDPSNTRALVDYAEFLSEVRKDFEKAEIHLKRAIDVDPRNPIALSDFAEFLAHIRKDVESAEEYHKRTVEASDSGQTYALSGYGLFLWFVREDADRAEELLKQAVADNPKDGVVLTNYANFLANVRKDLGQAENLYEIAMRSDRKFYVSSINFAAFAFAGGRYDDGVQALDRVTAKSIIPRFAARVQFLRYAHIRGEDTDALASLKLLLAMAAPSRYFDLSDNVTRAEADGHPNVPLLHDLARVLRAQTTIDALDQYPQWKSVVAQKPKSRRRRANRG
jgi:tetratricopeptide (TPR) repeat protein